MRRELALVACALALACGAPGAPRDPSIAITPIDVASARLERPDGARVDLPARPVLLHFWATWCAPCRRELPSLLAAAGEAHLGERVIAISVDVAWPEVFTFFGADIPAAVAREPGGGTARTLGVSTLPDTYLVDERGRATRRISHALDWERPEHRAWLAAVLGRPGPGER